MSKADKGKAKPTKRKAQPKPAPKVAKTKKVAEAAAEEKPKKHAKARKAREEAPLVAAAKPAPFKLGPPPKALVAARHLDSLQERAGKGFSFGELASASIPLVTAKRQGLSLDMRRRSVLEGNVESLRSWFSGSPVKAEGRTPPASKK